MTQYWDEEMTPEQEEAMTDRLAEEVLKRRMQAPAVLFLEMHKPLANVAASFLITVSPFVAPFVGMKNVDEFTQMLARPGAVERLIQKIEAGREEAASPA